MKGRKTHTKRAAPGVHEEHYENKELGKIKKIVDALERHNKKEIQKMQKKR